eukprot:s1466_g10.t1
MLGYIGELYGFTTAAVIPAPHSSLVAQKCCTGRCDITLEAMLRWCPILPVLLAAEELLPKCSSPPGVVEDMESEMALLQVDMVLPKGVDQTVAATAPGHFWEFLCHLLRAASQEVTVHRVRCVLLFCMLLVTAQLFTIMWHASQATKRPQPKPRTHTYQRGLCAQPKSAFS